MSDITRLNELHAATTHGDWQRCQANDGTCQCGLVWSIELDAVVANCGSDPLVADEVPKITDEEMVANSYWIAEVHNAWPAVAAELTRLREARELLTELRAKLAEHGSEGSPPVGGSVCQERDSRLAMLEEFDIKTTKVGEP